MSLWACCSFRMPRDLSSVIFVDVSPPRPLLLFYSSSTIRKSMSWSMRPLRKWSPPWSQRYSRQALSEPSHFITLRFGFCPFFSAGLHCDSTHCFPTSERFRKRYMAFSVFHAVVPCQWMLLCPKLVIVARAKSVRACHANIDLLSQFAAVLDGVLSKLSRYDEGTFFSSILSFTVSIFSFRISFRTERLLSQRY